MARPTDLIYTDFTSNLSDDTGIALRARNILAKIFRVVVGKTITTAVSLPISDATTQTALTQLRFYVKKGRKYRLEANLLTSGTAGGLRSTITGPVGTTLISNSTSYVVAGSASATTTALATFGAGAASNFIVSMDGYIQPIANGYVGISASQAVSSATPTVVAVGSRARLIRVK